MFNILIVEDISSTSEQIRKLIAEEIPEARTDCAGTVPEGLAFLRKNAIRPYDAIILDFRLPMAPGEHDEVDESVCYEARMLMPDALVIHITAFGDDPLIIRHLDEVHETQFGNKAIRLWKLDTDIAEQLMKQLKPELYGQRVLDHLHKLFNLRARTRSAKDKRNRFARGIRTGRSRTHELGSITREIASYWHGLNSEVKDQVTQIFSVKEKGDDVTVSIFRSSSSHLKE